MRQVNLRFLCALAVLFLGESASGAPPQLAKIDQLIAALADTNTNAEAQRALVKIGEPAAGALINGLAAPQGSITWWSCASVLMAIGDPALPALRRAAGDPRSRSQARAKEILARLEAMKTNVIPALERSRKARIGDARLDAIEGVKSLGTSATGIGATPVVPFLIEALSDEERDHRYEAASWLGEIGPTATAAVPHLIRLFDRERDDEEFVFVIVLALGDIGVVNGDVLNVLDRALRDPREWVRDRAAGAVRQLGERARSLTPSLIEALDTPNALIREGIVSALRDFHPEDPVPEFRRALSHRSPYVRFAVAQLVRYEDKEGGLEAAVPALIEGLTFEGFWNHKAALEEVRTAIIRSQPPHIAAHDLATAIRGLFRIASTDEKLAEEALRVVRDLDPPPAELTPVLAEALAHQNREVRLAAAELLEEMGTAAATAEDALQRRIHDGDVNVRVQTVKALGRIATGTHLLELLGPWLRDPHETVRAAAVSSIGVGTRAEVTGLSSLLNDRSALVRTTVASKLAKAAPADALIPLTIHLGDHEISHQIATALASFPEAEPYAALAMTSDSGWISTPAGSLAAKFPRLRQLARDLSSMRRNEALADLASVGATAFEEIAEHARSARGADRSASMKFLAQVQPTEAAIPALRGLMEDEDDQVRLDAAISLRRIGAAGWRTIIAELSGGSPAVRATAAFALARGLPLGDERPKRYGPAAELSLPVLIAALKDSDAEVRRAAAASIGTFLVDGRPAKAALVGRLRDSNRQVRLAAGFALRKLDAFSVNTLIAALRDREPDTRLAAADILGCLYQNGRGAEGALRTALEDRHAAVRAQAATALARIGRDVDFSGQTGAPRLLSTPEPVVLSGGPASIDVMLVVDQTGAVEDAWILRGDSRLNDATLAAVKQWRYRPATYEGKPADVFLQTTVFVRKP